MSDTPQQERATGAPDPDRLESWKEIAAYLNRGIRSVQRWEKTEGLPVHRLVHDRLGSIYAYKSELDAWWSGRTKGVNEEQPTDRTERDLQPTDSASSSRLRVWSGLVLFAAVVTTGIVGLLFLPQPRSTSSSSNEPLSVLTQLTSDRGLTIDPSVSRDGKLLAYASDRHSGEDLDIWVQQLARGGRASRITDDKADDHQPALSPDSTKIAFRSERDGGGIYLIPIGGGKPTLVGPEGRNPRFSPDGKWIAYWRGVQWGTFRGVVKGSLHVVSSDGGNPRQIETGLHTSSHPIWLPTSQMLLFYGKEHRDHSEIDWWVVAAGGGRATRTRAFDTLREQGISLHEYDAPSLPYPSDLTEDTVLFSGTLGDGIDLWQIPFARRTRLLTHPAKRLSAGAGYAVRGSMGPKGNIVFSSVAERVQIWAARLRPNAGVISGSPRQLTSTAGFEYYPSATRAGNLIAFISSRSGNRDIWIHDLRTGRESPLTESAANEWIPRVNAKGDVVAYALGGQGQDGIYFHPVAGTPQKAVDGSSSLCPWAWSHSGRYFIYGTGAPSTGGSLLEERYFKLLDLVTRRHSDLLKEPEFQLFQAAFSPDDAWIAFNGSGRIFVVPFNPQTRISASQWVPISGGEWINDKPRWSPDGTLIYFVSDRDGSRCIWAQRVDAKSKRPQGQPFEVYHAHHVRRTLATSLLEIALSSDHLIFSMSEITGNLWLRQR